jgi:acyl transferase domain-containing protein
VILEAPNLSVTRLSAIPGDIDGPRSLIFVFSAKSKHSLLKYIERIAEWLTRENNEDVHLPDLAYTLAGKRSLFSWRSAITAGSSEELLSNLRSVEPQRSSASRVVFLFTGQGAQWYAMGRELIYYCKEFRRYLSACDRILENLGSTWSLLDELQKDKDHSRINDSKISMPAMTALQIALIDLLKLVGCHAHAVIGHSSGEIAAAYCVGALSREAALAASYHRSFMSIIAKDIIGKKGGMLAVGMSKEAITELLSTVPFPDLSIACHNSPSSVTVSGDAIALDQLQELLEQRGIFHRRLLVDTAFHSHHMKAVADTYLSSLSEIESSIADPSQIFVSSVTGERKYDGFGSAYWTQNLISTVRFSEAIENYCKVTQDLYGTETHNNKTVFLEIGPHAVLAGPMKQILAQPHFQNFRSTYLPTLRRSESAQVTFASCLAKLVNEGCHVDVARANKILGGFTEESFVPGLPSYFWNHENAHWYESIASHNHRFRKHAHRELLGARLPESNHLEPIWQNKISVKTKPWLLDHVIDSFVIYPAASYLVMAVEGCIEMITDNMKINPESTRDLRISLRNIEFIRALTLAKTGEDTIVRMSMKYKYSTQESRKAIAETSLLAEFSIMATTAGTDWYEHCRGLVEAKSEEKSPSIKSLDLSPSEGRCDNDLNHIQIYNKLRNLGNDYGTSFSRIEELDFDLHHSVATLSSYPPNDDCLNTPDCQVIHPTTLDAIMHSCLLAFSSQAPGCAIMPVFIQEMVVSSANALNNSKSLITAESSVTAITSRSSVADVTAGWKGSRERSIAIYGMELRCLGTATFGMIDRSSQRMCHRVEWMPDAHFLRTRPWNLVDLLRLHTFKLPHCRIAVVSQTCEQLSSIVDALRTCSVPKVDVIDVITTSFPAVQKRTGDLEQIELRYLNIIDEMTIDARESHAKHVAFDLIICDESTEASMVDMTCKFLTPVGNILAPTTCSSKLCQGLGSTFSQTLPFMAAESHERNEEDANRKPQNAGNPADNLPSYHVLHRFSIGATANHDRNHCTSLLPSKEVAQISINIIAQDPRLQTPSTDYLLTYLIPLFATVHRSTWDTLGSPGHGVSIVFDNADNAFLANMTEKRFDILKRLVRTSSTIVWITNCTTSDAESLSLEGLVVGFARTCRSEYEKLNFVTIQVHDLEKNKAIIGNLIIRILAAPTPTELEYVVRDGEVLIPRVVPDVTVASWMSDKTAPPRQETSSGPFHSPGILTRLTHSHDMGHQFVQETDNRDLDAGMVRISARAFVTDDKFNSTDLENKACLTSVAGEIIGVSDDTKRRWKSGDRVIAWTFGSTVIANAVDIPAENVHALGSDTPAIAAAELLFTYAAVHCALIQLGSITEGQNILIDTADLSLANAAVRICKDAGARPKIIMPDSQTSNGTEEQTDLEKYMLVAPSTGGIIFDLVLTSGGTLGPAEISKLVRTFGTIIHLEKTSARGGRPETIQTDPNVTHMFLNLPALCQHKPDQINASMRAVSCRIAAHGAAPSPLIRKSIPVADLVDMPGKSRMHDRNGLLYVDCGKDLFVSYISNNSTAPAGSDFDGIYIVAGGFGDLGQMVCCLLAKLGAKHILVLSRRGASGRAYKKLKREVHKSNPLSHVWSENCDIGDPRDVEELTERYTASLGLRVRGIVHSAVVMKVSSAFMQCPNLLSKRHLLTRY